MYISYVKTDCKLRAETGTKTNSQNYLVNFVYRACVDYRQVVVIPIPLCLVRLEPVNACVSTNFSPFAP